MSGDFLFARKIDAQEEFLQGQINIEKKKIHNQAKKLKGLREKLREIRKEKLIEELADLPK